MSFLTVLSGTACHLCQRVRRCCFVFLSLAALAASLAHFWSRYSLTSRQNFSVLDETWQQTHTHVHTCSKPDKAAEFFVYTLRELFSYVGHIFRVMRNS